MGNTICGAKERHLIVPPVDSLQKKVYIDSESSDELLNDSGKTVSTILQLSVKCTNLLAENRFQLLSPMAEIIIKSSNKVIKSLETEVQANTLSAFFTKKFNVPFSLSTESEISLKIWDVPNKKTKNYLGTNSFSIHELAFRKDFITKELFMNEKRNGNLLLCANELKNFNTVVIMKWSVDAKVQLKNTYFLRLSKLSRGQNIPVYQSETKAPPLAWNQFEINLALLAKSSQTSKILAEVVELNPQMAVIGSSTFTISQLETCKSLQMKNNESTVAFLILENFSTITKSSFLDYMRSGIEICPFYTIDFSETHGHSNDKLEENQYLNTIKQLQQNLQYYSQDPLYTVLGTGAQFSGLMKPCFCFALNGNIFQPEVANHSNLTTYYQNNFEIISPAYKTNFAEILEMVIKYIKNEPSDLLKYYSVFIISAGDPLDVDDIVGKFSVINELPLSVFVMIVNNELIQYENLTKAKNAAQRPFFDFFDCKDVGQALDMLEKHVVKYAEYKNIDLLNKHEKIRTRSNSLKLSPEKIRTRSNYFTKAKAEYIEYLINIGYSSEKIDEINQIGVPYVVVNIDPNDHLPTRARTKTITIKQKSIKSSELSCLNCSKGVSKFVDLPCGCKFFCPDCVSNDECPMCK